MKEVAVLKKRTFKPDRAFEQVAQNHVILRHGLEK
jgi:hypothetical protein